MGEKIFQRLPAERRGYIWSCLDAGGVEVGMDDWMWRLRGEGERTAEIGIEGSHANDHWRDWGKQREIGLATRGWFVRDKEARLTWGSLQCVWRTADMAEFHSEKFPFPDIETRCIFSSPAPATFIWEMHFRNLEGKSDKFDFHIEILPLYPERISIQKKTWFLHFRREDANFFVGLKGGKADGRRLSSLVRLTPTACLRVVFCAGRKASLERFLKGFKADLARQRRTVTNYFRRVPSVATGNLDWDRLFTVTFDQKRLNLLRMNDGTVIECPDRPGHSSQWIWDSCFNAITWPLAGRKSLAVDMLLRLLRIQESQTGFIPMWQSPVAEIKQSQPPLISWALLEVGAPLKALQFAYPRLARFHEWFQRYRAVEKTGLCGWQTRQESGMDNSPRFDGMKSDLKMAAIDLNCQLVLDAECLSRIATRIRKADEARQWRQQAEALRRRLRRFLWDKKDGFFYDRYSDGRYVRVKTHAGFWALISKVATASQAKRLLGHLKDQEEFAVPFPVPSVALNEKAFDRWNMWRGPVWININYIIIRGLEAYGFKKEALDLAAKTIELVSRDYIRTGFLWECYDPLDGSGENTGQEDRGNRANHPYYCGWDGLVADLMWRYFRKGKGKARA